MGIVTIGIDAHKRSHTAVAIDEQGRQLARHTTRGTTSVDHLGLLSWARLLGDQLVWAVEDCRHLSRRLEMDLLAAGQRIHRVPPKLMAGTRASARSYGKSDPIDALAVARAALREPDLPVARLDETSRQIRLLADHRDDLVSERTRHTNRLRWHLHELDPAWDPKPKSLSVRKHIRATQQRLAGHTGLVAEIATGITNRIHDLTIEILRIETRLDELVTPIAKNLLQIPGISVISAATIIGQTAGITRFKSRHAYARHNGTAPQPASSGNTHRHRLSRTGNRRLNAVLHRIAITQARIHPGAIALLQRRQTHGDTRREAIRVLKRRLSDVVYRALTHDQPPESAVGQNDGPPNRPDAHQPSTAHHAPRTHPSLT